ncbi:MAG: phosphate ABC transporter, permease protein PstA [Candidatus Methanoperedenaceae archaeon]|nr:MAG: phosphate ABC transporter, permease protein PstA [Candidatus Methanoperedenaceae archaeon]
MKWNKRKLVDRIMSFLAAACVIIAIIPLLSILYTVIINGLPAIDLDFITKLPRPVGEPGGGLGNAIEGTFIVVGIACLIGLPIGILAGIYLSEYGENKFGHFVSFMADVLTGTPSIVAGMFGYTLVVLYFKSFSAIAGGVALSVLMIPIVTRTTEESLKLVPSSIKEASLALGIPGWKTTLYIVLGTGKSAIITGALLAIARISGETAPLLFTSFGNMFWSGGIDKPISTLPVQIYTYAITPFPDWHAKAWAGALILIVMILILNIGVRFAARKKFG